MMRFLAVVVFGSFVQSSYASVYLIANLGSAKCDSGGHLQNLTLTSVTCDYSEKCHYGDHVFVTGQVTATSDIPRPMKLTVSNTLPNWYSWGVTSKSFVIEDVCSSSVLSPPDVYNSGYSCPNAGVYNFHITHDIWGSSTAWYASWSGYTEGIAIHIQHEGGGTDYAMCTFDVHVKKSSDSSFVQTTYFVGIASLGVMGLVSGMFMRKRKEQVFRCGRDDREELDDEEDTVTNFELVEDRLTV